MCPDSEMEVHFRNRSEKVIPCLGLWIASLQSAWEVYRIYPKYFVDLIYRDAWGPRSDILIELDSNISQDMYHACITA